MGGWLYVLIAVVCAFIGFMTCALVSASKCSEYESIISELRAVIKYYRDKENNDKINNNKNNKN